MKLGADKLFFAIFGVALAILLIACSGGSTSEPSPPSPPGGVTATPAAQTPVPTAAARDCPVDQEICAFAREVLARVSSDDLDGLLGGADPVSWACRPGQGGLGGGSEALCRGAADGEVRYGYWDVRGGEGLIVPEGHLRRTAQRWLDAAAAAQGSDTYGDGEPQIGSIACLRLPSQPAGVCLDGGIRINLTFINSPDADVSQGTGIPGERITVFISAHRDENGEVRLDGIGNSVPPNAMLEAMEVPALLDDGTAAVFQSYPYRP